MKVANTRELLEIPEVVEEIKRHLWIESEKVGYDIGFDNAANDWLSKYSDAWVKQNLPGKGDEPKNGKSKASNDKKKTTKKTETKASEKKTSEKKNSVTGKRRRAKSYT